MKNYLIAGILLIAFESNGQNKSDDCAVELAEKVIVALGGKEKLNDVKNLTLEGYGFRNATEQSERFEGPYIPSSFNFQTSLDFENKLGVFRKDEKLYKFHSTIKFLTDGSSVVFENKGRLIPWSDNQTFQDDLNLNPLQIFTLAREDPSLECLEDSVIQKVLNKRIRFHRNGYPVTISINSDTFLPTSIEVRKPYNEAYLSVWGDVTKTVAYSFWELLGNGIHYPLQKDTYFLGRHWESSLITSIKINEQSLADSVNIPDELKEKSLSMTATTLDQLSGMMSSKSEIAKDIWLVPGYCNSTIIKQGNELIILEAPFSSANTDLIIVKAKEQFPGMAIKAIVSTSDAWLHCGGIRAAANISNLVVLDNNQSIVKTMLDAKFISNPDSWQKNQKKEPNIQYITRRTALGSGANRMELIPFRTESGERMMMVYFPEHKLLYASDLFQPGNWQKHYTYEVLKCVEREKLDVESVYAMHMNPTNYGEVVKSITDYLSGN